jgi:lysophospholipase L1-like esterase
LISWAVVAGLAYGMGAVTVHKRWFPYAQLREWKSRTADLPAEKPRASLFKYFSPDVEVVMVGDSLTQGGIWAEMFSGVVIANRGVGGDTAADILARVDTILSTKPELAFLMVGVNDAYLGWSSDEVFANYLMAVDALQQAGVEVVIQSTIECSSKVCGAKLDTIRGLNKKLVALAAERGLDYIDLNGSLAGESGLRPQYTYDGIHLNGGGYRQWVDALSGTMKEKVSMLRARVPGSSGDDGPQPSTHQ